MSRPQLGIATLAALEDNTARPVFFVEMELDGGTERLHTWLGTLTWGGNSWDGAGELASIDEVNETDDLSADAVRLGLNGIDTTIANIIDNEQIYRRPITLYLGAIGDDYQLVEDPGIIFPGYMQNLELTMGGENGDVALLTSESELLNFDRSRSVRYTDNQLQSEFSGDLGLEYIEQTINAKTTWRGEQEARQGKTAADSVVRALPGILRA